MNNNTSSNASSRSISSFDSNNSDLERQKRLEKAELMKRQFREKMAAKQQQVEAGNPTDPKQKNDPVELRDALSSSRNPNPSFTTVESTRTPNLPASNAKVCFLSLFLLLT
jgi:hypothetical protein